MKRKNLWKLSPPCGVPVVGKTTKAINSAGMPGYDVNSMSVGDWDDLLAEVKKNKDFEKLFSMANDLLMLVVKWQLKAS